MADSTQTVTVGGQTVSGFVTELTFKGDYVTLDFAGGASRTEDMSEVNIALVYDNSTTGIKDFAADGNVKDNRVYTVSGQYAGNSVDGLKKGVYIVNGKKIIVK